jgi:curved DNA-binding protein CbpA
MLKQSSKVPSTAMTGQGFIDYYELMQISPNAEYETVQRVYRMLATRFHPDNPNTGNADKFLRLNEAYEILRDTERRQEYDQHYQIYRTQPMEVFELKEFTEGIEAEANRRTGILCLLYNKRRTDPDSPGLSILQLEMMMSIPREHLMFTVWYLREKDFVRFTDNSEYAISAQGADHVESNLPHDRLLYRLLKSAEPGEKIEREDAWFKGGPAVDPQTSSIGPKH